MSLFAGTPDYSHIIWMPQQWPAKEEGSGNILSGFMGGMGAGMGMGGDMGKAASAATEGGGGGGGGGGGAQPAQTLQPVPSAGAPSESYLPKVANNISALIDSQQSMIDSLNINNLA